MQMRFEQITKERFEAYFYGRTPCVRLFSTELEWFSYENSGVHLA